MSKAADRTLTRREAILLSASVGISVAANASAPASDSIKTVAQRDAGNCSTPRSAIAQI